MFAVRLTVTTVYVGKTQQEEDSEEYGSPVVLASTIADIIKSRTEALLKKTKTAVSPKPIVLKAEYAHCPNLTIIDTPGFVLKVCVCALAVGACLFMMRGGELSEK